MNVYIVDIGTSGDQFAACLLRRDVIEGSHHGLGSGLVVGDPGEIFGNTKVRQVGIAIPSDLGGLPVECHLHIIQAYTTNRIHPDQ